MRTTVIALLVCTIAPAALLAADEGGKRVKATGRAIGDTEAAQEEAKLDALREAVRSVCGSFINSQTETENFQIVRDKILEQPVGFARLVKVLDGPKVIDGQITEVQIEAEVFPAQFERKWAEFAHIKQREGNPRCVIVVLEDDDPYDGKPPITHGLVQSELENFFLGKGVQLMDKEVTDAVRQRDLQLAAESGDLKKAAAAGAGFKADVVVLGTAEARQGDSVVVGGIEVKRWNVTLTVRAVQTDSAALLVSKTYRPKKAMTTTSGSGKDALTKVAQDAAPDVLTDIAKAWRERATVGKTIQLTIEPCTRRQFKAVQDKLIESKGITGGEDGFRLRELANKIASVEVNWKYDLEQLADRFEELSVTDGDQTLTFEVTELSANRFTVKARSAAATTAPAVGDNIDAERKQLETAQP